MQYIVWNLTGGLRPRLRRLTRFWSLSVLCVLAAPVWAQPVPPVGTWATIPNTRLVDALDPRLYPPFNPRDIFANSGGDLATWQAG